MALIIPCRNITPTFGNDCYLAENATIVGDVTMGDHCSVWWQAVVRGDVNFIKIGNKVNIQDGAIIHGTYQKCGTTIGDQVSIGHRAMVHGCTIEQNVLVGMGAIVMDEAVIEENCLIAAGAIILEKMVCKSGGVYAGVPAKRVKELTPELFKDQIQRIANNYQMYAGWFKK
jgi:carbonic anhydrase/acetyltransferase-like protein (isoleucine patch superfamily)